MLLAATLEIGANLLALLTPAVAGIALYLQGRKTSKEFKNNGGSTIRDAVDRMELWQLKTEDTLTSIADNQRITHERLAAVEARQVAAKGD